MNEISPEIIWLEEFLMRTGEHHADFLRRINVSAQRYNNWRSRGLPANMVFTISNALGVSPARIAEMRRSTTPKTDAAYDARVVDRVVMEPTERYKSTDTQQAEINKINRLLTVAAENGWLDERAIIEINTALQAAIGRAIKEK